MIENPPNAERRRLRRRDGFHGAAGTEEHVGALVDDDQGGPDLLLEAGRPEGLPRARAGAPLDDAGLFASRQRRERILGGMAVERMRRMTARMQALHRVAWGKAELASGRMEGDEIGDRRIDSVARGGRGFADPARRRQPAHGGVGKAHCNPSIMAPADRPPPEA
ncbi:protein of unknown function [Methylocella tundrae]|uniref:Uncharacterized protein n=1 Tax=Methylocella tundrae TaxID=227605 RepID=A0A4U8Z266_METTU|nr:protein of unknown function [Methylocella tundrae]